MSSASRRAGGLLAHWQNSYWIAVYTLALGALALGAFAFTRPVELKTKDEMPYQQMGQFAYFAETAQPVFDNNRLESGDPIFPQLGCLVTFSFDYQLLTPQAFIGSGSYQLVARVGELNGWHRQVELGPAATFSGDQFRAKQTLDVCQVQSLIQQVQEATGVRRTQYSLSVTPNVHFVGQVAGKSLEDSFSPALTFVVEPQQIYLPAFSSGQPNPLTPSISGLLVSDQVEANLLNIFSLKLPVASARALALIGLGLAAAGLTLPALILKNAEQTDERLRAKLLVGSQLVETDESQLREDDQVVDLAALDDLIRIAERFGSVVFFHQQLRSVDYLVREDGTAYRYRQMLAPGALAAQDASFVNEIERALKNSEMRLYFQPSVSLTTGEISQVEGLLRWHHPRRGLMLPLQFLPQAEQSNTIQWLDAWVLQNGCSQLRRWREAGFPPFPLTINVSMQQLRQPAFAQMVADALSENQLPGNLLQIEISKEHFILDASTAANLKALKAVGVGVTISDPDEPTLNRFGEFDDVSQVKISRTVVQQVLTNEQSGKDVRRWIETAHQHKVNVVAVGVETSEQLGFFQLNTCDEVQGFFISPPMPAEELTRTFKENSRLIDLSGGAR